MALSKILLPRHLRVVGWILLFPAVTLAYFIIFKQFEFPWLEVYNVREADLPLVGANENLTNELAIIILFICFFMIAFSREKVEDEYVQKIRLDSILYACYGYFFFNVLGALFIYGVAYFGFILVNMFTIPLIFIIRFRWIMFRQSQEDFDSRTIL